jgi:hypothetical protein
MWDVYIRVEAPEDLLTELAAEDLLPRGLSGFQGIKNVGLVGIVVQHVAAMGEPLRMVGDVLRTEETVRAWARWLARKQQQPQLRVKVRDICDIELNADISEVEEIYFKVLTGDRETIVSHRRRSSQ